MGQATTVIDGATPYAESAVFGSTTGTRAIARPLMPFDVVNRQRRRCQLGKMGHGLAEMTVIHAFRHACAPENQGDYAFIIPHDSENLTKKTAAWAWVVAHGVLFVVQGRQNSQN